MTNDVENFKNRNKFFHGGFFFKCKLDDKSSDEFRKSSLSTIFISFIVNAGTLPRIEKKFCTEKAINNQKNKSTVISRYTYKNPDTRWLLEVIKDGVKNKLSDQRAILLPFTLPLGVFGRERLKSY